MQSINENYYDMKTQRNYVKANESFYELLNNPR